MTITLEVDEDAVILAKLEFKTVEEWLNGLIKKEIGRYGQLERERRLLKNRIRELISRKSWNLVGLKRVLNVDLDQISEILMELERNKEIRRSELDVYTATKKLLRFLSS